MQEYLDQVRIEDLPESLQDIAEMVGLGVAIKLMAAYPGRRLFVPARGFPQGHPLRETLTEEELINLSKKLSSVVFTVPTGRKALQAARDRVIHDDRRAGLSLDQLCSKHKLSLRRITAIVTNVPKPPKAPKADEKQLTLL
jgi:Mor family transcriptional regulator